MVMFVMSAFSNCQYGFGLVKDAVLLITLSPNTLKLIIKWSEQDDSTRGLVVATLVTTRSSVLPLS